jgi:hypothetical protein
MDQFPLKKDVVMNMTMIALGSLIWGLFVAYIFVKWAQISTWQTGLQAGAIIGIFLALYWNFFHNAMKATADINWQMLGLDSVLKVVITAISGAATAVVIDKMKWHLIISFFKLLNRGFFYSII